MPDDIQEQKELPLRTPMPYVGGYMSDHAEDLMGDSGKPISIPSIIVSDIRDFLLLDYTYKTKYNFLDYAPKICPSIAIVLEFIPLTIKNNYLGPVLDEDAQKENGYRPSKNFLENVEALLSEIRFSDNLDGIVKGLLLKGDKVFKVVRVKTNNDEELVGIDRLETVPVDYLTIISGEMSMDEKIYRDTSYVVRDRDVYLLNEGLATVSKEGRVELESGGFAEDMILSPDILHFSYSRQDNRCQDAQGRITIGVWGIPPIESLRSDLKSFFMNDINYTRWINNAMPRQHHSINVDSLLNPDLYTATDKVKAIQTAVETKVRTYLNQRWKRDDDPNSATYGKLIEVEVDQNLITTGDITITSIGGQAAPFTKESIIKDLDRVICTRFGMPMSFFSFEEGSTFAIGRITDAQMNGFFGSLLRDIERDFKAWAETEFALRGWPATRADWENVYFDYELDDVEKVEAKNKQRETEGQIFATLSSMVLQLVNGKLLTPEQGMRVLKKGPSELEKMNYIKPEEPASPPPAAPGALPPGELPPSEGTNPASNVAPGTPSANPAAARPREGITQQSADYPFAAMLSEHYTCKTGTVKPGSRACSLKGAEKGGGKKKLLTDSERKAIEAKKAKKTVAKPGSNKTVTKPPKKADKPAAKSSKSAAPKKAAAKPKGKDNEPPVKSKKADNAPLDTSNRDEYLKKKAEYEKKSGEQGDRLRTALNSREGRAAISKFKRDLAKERDSKIIRAPKPEPEEPAEPDRSVAPVVQKGKYGPETVEVIDSGDKQFFEGVPARGKYERTNFSGKQAEQIFIDIPHSPEVDRAIDSIESQLSELDLPMDMLGISDSPAIVGALGFTTASLVMGSGRTAADVSMDKFNMGLSRSMYDDDSEKTFQTQTALSRAQELVTGMPHNLACTKSTKKEFVKLVEDHEVGHAVELASNFIKIRKGERPPVASRMSYDPDFLKLYRAEVKRGWKGTTHTAASSSSEAFAEVYVARRNGMADKFPKSLVDHVGEVCKYMSTRRKK